MLLNKINKAIKEAGVKYKRKLAYNFLKRSNRKLGGSNRLIF